MESSDRGVEGVNRWGEGTKLKGRMFENEKQDFAVFKNDKMA
jgi:hypothetical protein